MKKKKFLNKEDAFCKICNHSFHDGDEAIRHELEYYCSTDCFHQVVGCESCIIAIDQDETDCWLDTLKQGSANQMNKQDLVEFFKAIIMEAYMKKEREEKDKQNEGLDLFFAGHRSACRDIYHLLSSALSKKEESE